MQKPENITTYLKQHDCDEHAEICALCNGKCCRRYAGAFGPYQLFPDKAENEITAEDIKNLLEEGKVVVDAYEDYDEEWEHGYYLRPVHKKGTDFEPPIELQMMSMIFGIPLTDSKTPYFDQSYGGECSHFIDGKGCDLSIEDRPIECVSLVAKAGGCSEGLFKKDMADLWKPFFGRIQEALDTLAEND